MRAPGRPPVLSVQSPRPAPAQTQPLESLHPRRSRSADSSTAHPTSRTVHAPAPLGRRTLRSLRRSAQLSWTQPLLLVEDVEATLQVVAEPGVRAVGDSISRLVITDPAYPEGKRPEPVLRCCS